MADLLFANNAQSTLAGNLSTSSTTLQVQSGAGALFPNPGANQAFTVSLIDAATGSITEILSCTARSGDSMTVVRAQEGTSAQNWSAGDYVVQNVTAGQMAAMLQQGQDQTQASNYATDTSGSANTITVALSPAPTALSALIGAPVRIKVGNTTTGTAVNINPNGLGNTAVQLPDGSLPPVGLFVSGGIYEFITNGTVFFYLGGMLSSASSAETQAGTIANKYVSPLGLAGAMAFNHTTSGSVTSGYQKFPSGTIIQWGRVFSATGNADVVAFPIAFPTNATLAASPDGQSGALEVVNIDFAVDFVSMSVTTWSNGSITAGVGYGWMAIGY